MSPNATTYTHGQTKWSEESFREFDSQFDFPEEKDTLGDGADAFQALKRISIEKSLPQLVSLSDDDASISDTVRSDMSGPRVEHTRRRSSVQFSTVGIRKYDRTIGDHPSCTKGPALSLDWNYSEEPDVPIDTFEDVRAPTRSPRGHVFKKMAFQRQRILFVDFGLSAEESDLLDLSEEKEVRKQKEYRIRDKRPIARASRFARRIFR